MKKVFKKHGNELFDVAMGSYDGAEIADLVGLFILHILRREINLSTYISLVYLVSIQRIDLEPWFCGYYFSHSQMTKLFVGT